MRTFTFLAAFFALLSFTSAQSPVCTPSLACSAALSSVPLPVPYYALNFSTDPRSAGAVYSWQTSGANETAGCASSAFHTGILQLIGSSHDTSTLGPSVNLTAPVGQPNAISTPLPTNVLFGNGTSLGSVLAGTAGWSIEIVFKAYAITTWAKVFDIGAGGGGGHYDTLLGWNSGNNYLAWTANGANNGGSDIEYVINPVVLNQWYHALMVWQETAAGNANWIFYQNGQQTQSLSNGYFPPAVARPSANLGRSNWADQYWSGEIDTFNIYQYAISPLQAQALAANAMGGCSVTYASTAALAAAAAALPTAAPAPFFEANFSSDPRAAAGGVPAANYGWIATDADDATCSLGLTTQHQGLLQLTGQYTTGNPVGGYVNLTATSGPDAIGGPVLPTIGGASAGVNNTDSYGWSFEVTFKAELAYPNSKVFDIAAPQLNGNCQYDILFGVYGNPVQSGAVATAPTLQFELCDGASNQNVLNGFGPIQLGTWYHVVAVVQQLPYSNKAMYTTYINGVRAGLLGNAYYPEAVARANADLGRSNWAPSGDSYFGGLVDTFRVYNYALNPAQIATLSTAALGSAAVLRCPQITTGLPTTVPSDALIFSATFNQDPRAAAGGASNALYTWMASDPTDTAADQAVHTGLIKLGGSSVGAQSGIGPYVNLSAPSGPASIGQVLPLIGTDVAGLWSQGSVGFTIELSVKMLQQTNWGKVYDLGATRTGGNCNGDLIFGWVSNTNVLEFETCTDSGSGSNRLTILPNANLSVWHHVTVVVQQTYSNLALATGYLNGQVVGNMTLAYPFAEYRRDATLGRSLWNDAYINATYDLFNVYQYALNPAQVGRLYAAASSPTAPAQSSSGGFPAQSSSSAIPARGSSSSAASSVSAAPASSSSATVASSSSAAVVASSSSARASSSSTGVPVQSSSAATSAVTPVVSSSAALRSSSSSSSSVVVVPPASSSSSSPAASSSSVGPVPVAGDSSSSSSSTGSSSGLPPPISTSSAASTVASAVVLAVCAMASLALML